ncbi:RusA family crossover junction endodeoxyribonuclease [Paenibacillus sp. HWE-109]|uniref:RusA family crossover junction endodeoxyribonuclease n=1 Tax=Paenibacillus sp. HWE-109 TaxID=1306526 RepID=UPI001EE056C4|nr:RusA family crossover junction endodeoxyribonuclease [Paenibacillus sp. HWE-109]UKS25039.1 RusA family crossover junction endodeoxyribonuclease [Paenibacillus sp. HWE-109]
MKIVIPGTAPSVNHMYENRAIRYTNKKGQAAMRRIKVLSRDAEHYQNLAILLAKAWRTKNKWKPPDGKVIVNLWYFWPDNKKRDTHNTLKLLLDCLEAAQIYTNDRYALPRIMDYEVDKKNPRVEIEIVEVIS